MSCIEKINILILTVNDFVYLNRVNLWGKLSSLQLSEQSLGMMTLKLLSKVHVFCRAPVISSIRMGSIDSKTIVRSLGLGGSGGNVVVSIIMNPVDQKQCSG